MMNMDVPDSTIIKCLIRDNKCLISEIAQMKQIIDSLNKEIKHQDKKYTQKCQEFSNYKSQSKAFYNGITKEDGIGELIKQCENYKKEEIKRLRKEVDQLQQVTGKYAKILIEHNLL